MKKILSIAVVAVVLIAGVVFVPGVVHTCDDCGKVFVGTGYEPNALTDLLSSDGLIICKQCAEEQHALSIAMGQSLEDFKRDLFE